MTTVSLKNIVKRYNSTEVVHSINLEIQDSEFIVLVGPSGCGKSTTLRMIAGLEEISSGEIRIGDRVVNEVAPKDRGVAMVFQNYALYPHMNVYNNMSFGLKLKKTPKDEIQDRVANSAKILNIESLLERKPAELSGGQRQRVAMGRAIVRNPEIFLFDEPLSNLDAKLRTQMRIEIKQLHQRMNNTIIYVTHDQIEAMTLGDRIVVMRDGYIEQVGEPIELFQNPVNTFVAGFIGNPPMNLNNAEVVSDEPGFCLSLNGGIRIPIPEKQGMNISNGQKVIMGLRTEDINLTNNGEDTNPNWTFDAVVDVTEPLGSETYAHLDLKGNRIIGRCEGRTVLKTGDRVRMRFNLTHLHVFDAESTKSVY